MMAKNGLKTFTITEVLKVVGLERFEVHDWLRSDRKMFKPELPVEGQGKRHPYTFRDLMFFKILKILKYNQTSPRILDHLLKFIQSENVASLLKETSENVFSLQELNEGHVHRVSYFISDLHQEVSLCKYEIIQGNHTYKVQSLKFLKGTSVADAFEIEKFYDKFESYDKAPFFLAGTTIELTKIHKAIKKGVMEL